MGGNNVKETKSITVLPLLLSSYITASNKETAMELGKKTKCWRDKASMGWEVRQDTVSTGHWS